MLMVLGAHRSGTSALAGTIQRLGIDLGEHLLGPEEGVNDRGFWEHGNLVALHDHLLEKLGSRWDSIHPLPENWWQSPNIKTISGEIFDVIEKEFGNSQLWGLKDPRLCRLLPLWLDILAQVDCKPSFIIVYRHPLEVAESLSHRDQIQPQRALNIWLQHMLDAEFYTRDYPRTVISYNDLLDDWRSTMLTVSDNLSLQWPIAIDQAGSEVDHFLEGSLRHHRCSEEELANMPTWIKETYSSLQNTQKLGDEDLKLRFDKIRHEYQAAVSLYSPLLLSEENKFNEIESEFINACAMVEDHKTHANQQMKTLHDVERGFKQAVEMLHERDAELTKTNALLTGRLRPLAEALDEWEEDSTVEAQTEKAEQENDDEDDKVYEGIIDLRVTNNSHTQLYNFIQEDSSGHKSRVLEAGCSSGYFGAALKKAGHEVWGVEISPKAAARAREKLDHVFVGTIEEFLDCDAVKGVKFDYITFGDVLEHLVDPEQALKDCRRILSPDGSIAASIPNIAHKAARLMLLEGRWDYAEFGILDNTHLRFFTRNSIVDIFTNAGFEVHLMDAVTLPTDGTGIDVNPDLLEATSSLITGNDQEVFQFTVLARKSDLDIELAERNLHYRQGEGTNILCLLPFADWSIGNIRIRDPLLKFCQQYGGQVRISSIYEHESQDISWADTVILQRDSNKYVLGLIDILQKMGKRVIIDMDDLLTEVPPFLTCYEHCQQTKPYLLEALRMADAITVTTQRLKDEMIPYNKNVHVVPNCVSTVHEVVKHYESDMHKVNLLIASTDTVRVDFIASALERLANDRDINIEIICIGPPGEFLQGTGLAIQAHENMSYSHFKAFLATLDNTIGIIPLCESRFSRCKSAVKFLDFSLSGIPTVCSDVPPYNDSVSSGENGILCANLEEDWCQAIRKLVLSAPLRTEIANTARQFTESEFPIKHAADCWNKVFTSTQAGQGKQGSELLAVRKNIPILLHYMMSLPAWRSALRVLHKEGFSGVKSRLSRRI